MFLVVPTYMPLLSSLGRVMGWLGGRVMNGCHDACQRLGIKTVTERV